MKRPERLNRWSDKKLKRIGYKIIRFFYTTPAGDGGRQFGCDWPTMNVLYPLKCRLFRRLKAEYNRRQNET